jgi:hypothetical protein
LWQVAARRSLRTLGTDLQQKAIKAIVYVGCERKPDFAGQSFASNPNNFDTTSATAPAAWPYSPRSTALRHGCAEPTASIADNQ